MKTVAGELSDLLGALCATLLASHGEPLVNTEIKTVLMHRRRLFRSNTRRLPYMRVETMQLALGA